MIPAPQFAISPQELIRQIEATPQAPPIEVPPMEPVWMPELGEAMVAPGWLERQVLIDELVPPQQRRGPFLDPQQRAMVKKAWARQMRERQ